MNFKILIIFFCILVSKNGNAQQTPRSSELDSTIHEKFVVKVLSEYELGGRWLSVNVDSCNKKKWRIVIDAADLNNAYPKNIGISKEQQKILFVSNGYTNIITHDLIEDCPALNQKPIGGYRINELIYEKLSKQRSKKVLKKYFNKDHYFKSKYSNVFHEVVAVCFNKNIQVITENTDLSYYKQ